jgi:Uma2 family endonuclease
MQHARVVHYPEDDYLKNEAQAPGKHEYVAGEVFAMAGASKRHGTLAGNAFIAIRQHLRGKPCGVWMADMKVRVNADCAFYYPDVVVTCDPADLSPDAPKDYLQAPGLIMEVLSDSTEPVDRREKLLSYRRLPSLMEYVLVDQNRAWVEVFRRTLDGWMQDIYGAGETVALTSLGLDLPMTELYADTEIEAGLEAAAHA